MKLLVCGGAGFIGSNFIHYVLAKYDDMQVVNFDKLTYAGNPDNVRAAESNSRYVFEHGDICDFERLDEVVQKHGITHIINFAAETHNDRSVHDGARTFVMTNVLGVQTILDIVRSRELEKFVQVSTDEVYGSLELDEPTKFTEDTPIAPNIPYAAAKAGGDLMCKAAFHTFGTPVIVSHCTNNYGPYQFPEKLIPYFISLALDDKPLPLYGDGKNVRDWIFVLDHCQALDLMLQKGVVGEVYNSAGGNEKSNIEIARLLLGIMNKPDDMIEYVTDRPGHDRRYAMDPTKVSRELGWNPDHTFEQALPKTVEWYLGNRPWVDGIKRRVLDINAHIR
ncbi:MAG: dTDP-glucose 4,6-dehydratase [bacterium]|nr:dTDP-glucose 4,6-dehydratase [bacterium]